MRDAISWADENAEILAIRGRLKSNDPRPYSQLVSDSKFLLDYIDRQHVLIDGMIDKLGDMIGDKR